MYGPSKSVPPPVPSLFAIDAQSALGKTSFPRRDVVAEISRGDLDFLRKVPLASSVGKIPPRYTIFRAFSPLYRAHISGDIGQIKLHRTRTQSYFDESEAPVSSPWIRFDKDGTILLTIENRQNTNELNARRSFRLIESQSIIIPISKRKRNGARFVRYKIAMNIIAKIIIIIITLLNANNKNQAR